MIEYFIIGILVTLLLGQHVFWAKEVHRLVDKLMCRNFHDYQVGLKMNRPNQSNQASPSLVDDADPIGEQQAKDLNSMFGIV